MSRKKGGGDGNDEPSAPFWMLTYGDVMTLLLTFFVLLLSFSSIQEAKFKEAMNALQEALGVMISEESVLDHPLPPEETEQVEEMQEVESQMAELIEIVKEAQLGEEIDVIPTEQGYAIRISSPVLFDLASADIKPVGAEMLRELGKYLSEHDYPVKVEGHTDNIPIHNAKYPSNWELSTARSLSVLRLLNSQDVAATRLSAAGYGEFKPLLPNDSPENRQVNRRVEIYVQVKSSEENADLGEDIRR